VTCKHLFARRRGWWRHTRRWMRWACIKCGYRTRTYDMPDRMAMRPAHPHMTVALPGYNTTHKESR
jgi:hypothetical protein